MTRPVDVDGTPLHVGDLVESRWSAPGHWGAGARKSVVRINGAPSGWFASDGGQVVASAFRRVPETRHERIVRRSHERPQVVQVRWSDGRLTWALIKSGRMVALTRDTPQADVMDYADQAPVKPWWIPNDGKWTVL